MTELEIYQIAMQVAIAHENKNDHKQVNGFAVGYPFELNAENVDTSKFRGDLFYSEKWYQGGKREADMVMDYPVMLMLPVRRVGEIPTATQTGNSDFTVVIWILDLLYNDRHNNKDSKNAKRSRAQVFNDTSQIAQAIMIELKKKYGENRVIITGDKKYTEEKVYNFLNDRTAGSSITFGIRITNECPSDTFNYEKTYSASQPCT